ncbi:MAG: anion permease [Gammaproteobacteria bacterium]|nr:anion permease [Gammaproteobacteria bacterium]
MSFKLPKYGNRQRTGLLLGPLLFLVISLSAESLGLDAEQRWAAATVMLMATWWITEPIPLWATACLPLIIYPLTHIASLFSVTLQYFDPINFLFFGGMLIAAAMQQWGLHRRIALGIVDTIGTSPRRIVLGFMLGTGFISLWISNTATAMMMYPIGMAVLLKLEEQDDADNLLLRHFGLALMLGIAYAANIGGIGTKIGTAPNLVFVKQAGPLLGHDVDFLTWFKVGLPIVLIALPLVWWYLVRIAAPLPSQGFAGSSEVIAEERAGLGAMNRGERIVLIAFVLAALLWIFRKDIELGVFTIPGWWRYVTFGWEDIIGRSLDSLPASLAKLLRQDSGDAAVAMSIGCTLLIIPVAVKPLRFTLDVRNVMRVPWHLLVLLGGSFAMAYGIQESGLTEWIAGLVTGIGQVSPLVIFLTVCLLTVALSEVASNTATASIFLPLIASSAGTLGVPPAPLMLAAAMAASFGFMLPAGTPPNAIVFASGYITVPQMARNGLLIDLFGAMLVAVLCYLIAPWALGI